MTPVRICARLPHHVFTLLPLLSITLLLNLVASAAQAQWIHTGRSYTSGSPQFDGQGNLITRLPAKIDTSGNIVWSIGGSFGGMAPDGAGGVIGVNGTLASRINSNGTFAWSGVVFGAAGMLFQAALATDAAGNSFMGWKGNGQVLFTAKVSASGVSQWTPGGVIVSNAANQLGVTYVRVVPDESGGCYILWEDFRTTTTSGPTDVYMQHFNSAGSPLWTANGIPIASGAANQIQIAACSDGAGGVIVAWSDNRSGTDYDLYVQRVDGAGTSLWTANGMRVYADAGGNPQDQVNAKLLADGAGGAFLVWGDFRNAGINHGSDIFAQRLDSAGALQWGADGVSVAATTNAETTPVVSPDGSGGVFIGWQSAGSSVQHLTGAGAALWLLNGIQPLALSGGTADLVADGAGGCYAGTSGGALARLYPNGKPTWGREYQARNMVAADIPGDEGGYVSLGFDRSPADGAPGFGSILTGYSVWKRRPGTSGAATARLEDPRGIIAGLSSVPSVGGPPTGYTDFPSGTWDAIAYAPAIQIPAYSLMVPTSSDSTSSGSANNDYVIMSHTSNQIVFVLSPNVSGHSVDNLPPGVPQNLTGSPSGSGVLVQWEPSGVADFWHYAVYRGTSPSFTPSTANRIGQPTTASLQDDGYESGVSHYKVSTFDRHGNESGFALLTPSQIVAVPPGSVPLHAYLGAAAPNPFNSQTALEFGMAHRGSVRIDIYDSNGRRVRQLMHEVKEPGIYRAVWNGQDDARHRTSSGLYFAKFEGDGLHKSVKIVQAE